MDMLSKSYIKRWLNIPCRGVTDVGLFHPYMLNIKQPSRVYLTGHISNHTSMRIKGDSVVNSAIMSQVSQESQWTRKSSTAVTCENIIVKGVENDQFMIPTSENT